MRRLTLLLLTITGCMIITGCAARNGSVQVPPPTPPPVQTVDWSITMNWNEDFTNFIPCTTNKVGCIAGFTWGYISGGNPVTLKISPVTVCTGTAQPEACTDTVNAMVGIGSVTPFAIANAYDNSGNPINSTQANGTPFNVPVGVPASLSMTLK